jgi:hypothetical protein
MTFKFTSYYCMILAQRGFAGDMPLMRPAGPAEAAGGPSPGLGSAIRLHLQGSAAMPAKLAHAQTWSAQWVIRANTGWNSSKAEVML